MKLRTKYLISFFSSTLITLVIVGLSIFGFYRLDKTTNYLVTVNSRVMEYSNLYEKELAKSRRAEKEFFIFPDNLTKQIKYINAWKNSMDTINDYLKELNDLFIHEQRGNLSNKVIQAENIVAKNRLEWDRVVTKFQETRSYDTVDKAEYGKFKEQTHTLEDIGKEISAYALSEVEKGRLEINRIQKQTDIWIKLIAIAAVLWGFIAPIIFARQMTSTIIYLSKIANDISKGDMEQEIEVNRKDELGDMAQSIKRLQTSMRVIFKKISFYK
ncbi:MAG: hypothetical protein CVV37_03975 [Nitrospira bacterium HGW-Nitrospira-1]|nr:MAG: hypothetical protein CVV37_03975 [Nitrospira bacterium HGW-Nitrospira-1]